jgi:hypothetical protein
MNASFVLHLLMESLSVYHVATTTMEDVSLHSSKQHLGTSPSSPHVAANGLYRFKVFESISPFRSRTIFSRNRASSILQSVCTVCDRNAVGS